MIPWLILIAITLAAAVYVAVPFLRQPSRTLRELSAELGTLRGELAELDRKASLGSIEPAAAEKIRAEIKGRMLAAAERLAATAPPAGPDNALESKFVAVVVAACTVLGSAILYTFNSNTGLPSAAPNAGDTGVQSTASGTAPALENVDSMIGKLRDRLAANPNDPKGWAMLGWSYMSTQKFDEAVAAYRKALSLNGKSADIQVGLADSLIQQAGGQVTPEAKTGIETALSLDPKEPRALFLRGLGKSQSGDAKGAIDEWVSVLALASPADPWAAEVRQQIEALAKQANIDVSGRLPAMAKAGANSAPAAGMPTAGPTQAEVEAAQKMPESDRAAMIKGMVDRLAQKLETTPRNLEGWVQLIRARKVMGDTEGAKAALKRGQEVFADSPPDLDRLKATASDLGVAQ